MIKHSRITLFVALCGVLAAAMASFPTRASGHGPGDGDRDRDRERHGTPSTKPTSRPVDDDHDDDHRPPTTRPTTQPAPRPGPFDPAPGDSATILADKQAVRNALAKYNADLAAGRATLDADY